MNIIRVGGLIKRYGSRLAVDGIDISVARGQIVALLGPNGSGKSTTVRCLAGLIGFDEGEVAIDGFRVDRDPCAVKQRIGVLAEAEALFPGLSIEEHLLGEALIRGLGRAEARARSEDLLRFFALWDDRHTLAEHGSVGMRKKLGIALALVHRPPVLILDEPFEGLDPIAADRTVHLLDRIRASGTTILITSHLLALLSALVDEVVLIDRGRIRDRGGPEDLAARYRAVFAPSVPEIPEWLH